MRVKLVTGIICLGLLAALIGCGGTPTSTSTTPGTTQKSKAPVTVALAQDIIDAAVKAVQNQPSWGISLLDPTLNLLTGVAVLGAIVLHNGEDVSRMVTLKYTPATKTKTKWVNDEQVVYTPVDASGWVTFGETNIRLAPMETRTISITIFIPNGTKFENKDFRFDVTADAGIIYKQTYDMDIATDSTTKDALGNNVPDNFLEATLGAPLMLNSTQSITKLTSSIEETLTAKSYEPKSMVLRIEGLKTSASRTISLEYDATSMFRQAYVQNWYVSMR